MNFAKVLFVPKYAEGAEGNQLSRLEWSFTEERRGEPGGVAGGFTFLLPCVMPEHVVVSSLPVFDNVVVEVGTDGSVKLPEGEPGLLIEWWHNEAGLSVTFTNVLPEPVVDVVVAGEGVRVEGGG